MLQYLKINNFLLLKSQEINFTEKFAVITGETGSGKSMIIKALRFVLGEKIDNLENLNEETSVIAQFSLDSSEENILNILKESDIEIEDGSIIIRRTINSNNKSKIFINDVIISQNLLKKISSELIEFHSQQKQLEAFNQSNCLGIIDNFVQDKNLLYKVYELYTQIKDLEKLIAADIKDKEELEKDKEYIEHSFSELQKLNPKLGEEEELVEKKNLYSSKTKIIQILENLSKTLTYDNNLSDKLIRAQREISKIEELQELSENIESSISVLNLLQSSLDNSFRIFSNDEDIEYVTERLSKIKELSRKYRCTPDQLVDIQNSYEEKLHRLSSINRDIEIKSKQKFLLCTEYLTFANDLSILRKEACKHLQALVSKELNELRLEHVEFKIELLTDSDLVKITGINQAKFLIKTNKGFAFAQVHEVASGGELSRIMLALKVALAKVNRKATIIFDEIDAGTGGAVAETIGNRLKRLSQDNQIITISHQPQVASKASLHLYIEKIISNKNETKVRILNQHEKVNEIARMLAGINITEAATKAALDLIEN